MTTPSATTPSTIERTTDMPTLPPRSTIAPSDETLDLDKLRALARKGEAAAAELAAVELARQQARTAELAAAYRRTRPADNWPPEKILRLRGSGIR